jgi:hypothetical protein
MLYPSELQARSNFRTEARNRVPYSDSIAERVHALGRALALSMILYVFGQFFDFFGLL